MATDSVHNANLDMQSLSGKFSDIENVFKEAEETFRKGIGFLDDWSKQAQDILENRPGIVLAAVGISGFVTGALIRHAWGLKRNASSGAEALPADPAILFFSGLAAGVLAGPKIIHEAVAGIKKSQSGRIVRTGSESVTRIHTTPPMNQKPFEKY